MSNERAVFRGDRHVPLSEIPVRVSIRPPDGVETDGRAEAGRSLASRDQHRPVPFPYIGVHEGVDLRDVSWRRGRGYDVDGLSQLYTGNDAWVRLVLKELAHRVNAPAGMRSLRRQRRTRAVHGAPLRRSRHPGRRHLVRHAERRGPASPARSG